MCVTYAKILTHVLSNPASQFCRFLRKATYELSPPWQYFFDSFRWVKILHYYNIQITLQIKIWLKISQCNHLYISFHNYHAIALGYNTQNQNIFTSVFCDPNATFANRDLVLLALPFFFLDFYMLQLKKIL